MTSEIIKIPIKDQIKTEIITNSQINDEKKQNYVKNNDGEKKHIEIEKKDDNEQIGGKKQKYQKQQNKQIYKKEN